MIILIDAGKDLIKFSTHSSKWEPLKGYHLLNYMLKNG